MPLVDSLVNWRQWRKEFLSREYIDTHPKLQSKGTNTSKTEQNIQGL